MDEAETKQPGSVELAVASAPVALEVTRRLRDNTQRPFASPFTVAQSLVLLP